MKILWVIDLEYACEMHHGANLRFFNLSQELIINGHEVYFVTHRKVTDDPVSKYRYLDRLVEQKTVSGHLELSYAPPTRARRLARLAAYPAFVNRFLKEFQDPPRMQLEDFLGRHHIDLCIFSNRPLMFLVESTARLCPTFIDWIDSHVLLLLREIPLSLKKGRLAGIPYLLRWLVDAYTEESYYGKRCHLNLTVSRTDKRCFDFVDGRPHQNRVLSNGVRMRSTPLSVAPIRNRLVFSGNMSYPPNYEAAIWFIDKVLPLLLKKKPDIRFVVAGANPVPQLLARNGGNVCVTGLVEDLELEIAKSELYVAPLVSGCGFKNKIVEAIAANRFVVATSRAVEFLDVDLQSYLLVADTPRAMADYVLAYLDNPSKHAPALAALRKRIGQEFTWANRAESLLQVACHYMGVKSCDAESAEDYAPAHGYPRT